MPSAAFQRAELLLLLPNTKTDRTTLCMEEFEHREFRELLQ